MSAILNSCLCLAEILAALYGQVLRISSPTDPDRDRFILSKGHAALALYAALSQKGWLSEELLDTFCGEGSLLGVHPESEAPGIDFSTGSLGHGLCFAAGAALAARLQGSQRRVFCLISDAECNEGSIWEASAFAAHHSLHNLTAIVDLNRQQAFGLTRDVLDMSNLRERWKAFGWQAIEVDGHDVAELIDVLNAFVSPGSRPRLVMAHTIFGRGVSFMEQGRPITQAHLPTQPITWHYLPLSAEEHQLALAEIESVR